MDARGSKTIFLLLLLLPRVLLLLPRLLSSFVFFLSLSISFPPLSSSVILQTSFSRSRVPVEEIESSTCLVPPCGSRGLVRLPGSKKNLATRIYTYPFVHVQSALSLCLWLSIHSVGLSVHLHTPRQDATKTAMVKPCPAETLRLSLSVSLSL